MNEQTAIGHNKPPAFRPEIIEGFEPKVQDFADAAGAWLDLGEIETEAQAEKLNDFIKGCRGLHTKIRAEFTVDKKPHLDAGNAVGAAYNPLTDTLKRAKDRVEPLLTRWSVKKAAAEKKARDDAIAAAAAEQAAAQKLLDEAAKRNDVAGEAEAEQAAKDATKAAAIAARTTTTGRVASATGGGRTAALRTYRTATVTSLRQAFLALEAEHGGDFRKMIALLANQHLRADPEWVCAGIEITTEQRIA